MKIILSQRIDIESDYEDVPFSTYHFPKRHLNQIHTRDQFIYYQGSRFKKEYRYYFGCGVIGAIVPDATGEHFYAYILEGRRFPINVPIYLLGGGGFIESIGYEHVRNKPNPSWQYSVRRISDDAFFKILQLANVDYDAGENISLLETGIDALDVLRYLNSRYANISPRERAKKIQHHFD